MSNPFLGHMARRSPSEGSIPLDPVKFYQLADMIRTLDKAVSRDLDDLAVQLDEVCDKIDDQADALAKANNAVLAEARRSTKRRNPFETAEEHDDIFSDLRHTIDGDNFLRVIFDVVSGIQLGFRNMRDIARGLRPEPMLLSRKHDMRALLEDLDFDQLQKVMLEVTMNDFAVNHFIGGVLGAEEAKANVIRLGRVLTQKLDHYYNMLNHRHSVEGIQIHEDPVTTDLAMSIFENVDANGEIQDGKDPDQLSAYSARKATLIADSIKTGLVGEFVRHPARLIEFITDHMKELWMVAEHVTSITKPVSEALRKIIGPALKKPKTMNDREFAEALEFLKDLDPQSITYREKTGLLTAEERFALNFRNETLRNVAKRLSDKTSTDDLIQYILRRKAELRDYYRDENSFYVCRVGNGNPFLGSAPGELEVIPGTRPVVNLEEIIGTGFDDVKNFISQVETSSKWHELFLATSPSRTADKSNVLLIGPQGCHRKGQKILMFDGTLTPVEQIRVGDQLMGPDSKPRTVLKLHRGVEEMVEIIPTKGDPWVVNKGHILTLVRTQKKCGNWGGKAKYTAANEVKDVAVSDYLGWSKTQKHIHALFRTGVEFEPATPLPLEPYFLGVLLGDGCLRNRVNVTNTDEAVIQEVYTQAGNFKLRVSVDGAETRSAPGYHLSGTQGKANPITTILKKLGLFGCDSETKFIPYVYKTASREDRLELLAGLIDTDGGLHGGCYDITLKSKALADDIAFVARSLGLAAYVAPCRKKSQNGTWGDYFRVGISGHTHQIPVRVEYKQAKPRRQVKNVLRTGFKTRELPAEEFFGFTLDGDHRYLLGDFTVTHNCGKSEILRAVGGDKKSIGIFAVGSDFLTCWKGEAEKNPKRLFEAANKLQKEAKKHVHILIDEIDTVLNKESGREAFGGTSLVTEFQNLMDGVVHYPNLSVWGATNNAERIPMPMIRRFSKVLIVGELDQADRVNLLKHFAAFMPTDDIDDADWNKLAARLDGATGDVIRKIVDYIWRSKMTWFIQNNQEQAEKLRTFLQGVQGQKFTLADFKEDQRTAFKVALAPYVRIHFKDLNDSISTHLENVAIHHEIETAKSTYARAKAFLATLRKNGAPAQPEATA